MKKDILQEINEDYLIHTAKASNIARGVASILGILQLYFTLEVNILCVVFFILELFQYSISGLSCELMLRNIITISVRRIIVNITSIVFYSKIVLTFIILGGLL